MVRNVRMNPNFDFIKNSNLPKKKKKNVTYDLIAFSRRNIVSTMIYN